MPSIAVQSGTAPLDLAFPPASWQILLNTVASYVSMSGLENLVGVIISATEPAAADRDKVWMRRDVSSERPIGLYVYTGEWLPVPFVIPSGEEEPSSAQVGELFYNTLLGALRFYNGVSWTTNLWPTGTSANRPEDPPAGYLYFDSDLGRLLRMTSSGWSTFDGGIGDVKMVDFADEDTALAANPGWSIFAAMYGRFPLGASVDQEIGAQSEGGVTLAEMKLDWIAQGRSGSGGTREASASFISALTLNGTEARADGSKYDALTKIGPDKTVSLKPPYKALIFLRKEF